MKKGPLSKAISRFSRPVIATERDLISYVIATTLLCLFLALSADITNQLVFFENWETALRSWAITCLTVLVIAIPVSYSIGRTALQLTAAKQTIAQQLQALTEAHNATEAAYALAEAMARHDALTGLPNRRMFAEALANLANRRYPSDAAYAVVSIDLDRFKPVNDLYGHATGDELLCEIASRLRNCVKKRDIVARFGGDEFSALIRLRPVSNPEAQTAEFATRVLTKLAEPMEIAGRVFTIGASIGVALYPRDGIDPETILRAADMAMYRAKQQGRGQCQQYNAKMEMELTSREDLEAQVRNAVQNGEIVPYYQPLVRLSNQELIGFEVLSRWHGTGTNEIGPAIFIPVIERLGLIGQFTYSLLRTACLDAQKWPSNISIALNVSAHHLKDPLLPIKFLSILSETSFPPSRLEVEVTETALIEDVAIARATLQALRDLGIRIALDDFGTGYSNLQYLSELPVDKIKIDQTFVRAMSTDVHQAKIVRSVLDLAKTLDVPAVAEGVETQALSDQLISIGAEFGQGYCFGKAVRADVAGRLVLKRSPILPISDVA